MRPLLDGHPDLTGFISDPTEIARLKLDAVVHLHPDKECYLAAHNAAVPIRIGYCYKSLSKHLTHALEDRRTEGLKHEAAYNFDLLQLLGVVQPARLKPSVHLPESALGSLRATLPWPLESTRFAILNPSAHSPVARWPIEYFLLLADKLQSEHGLVPVFIGADSDDSIPAMPSRFLNLAGKTDLGELGWLLKHARVLVSRDTGPSHLAAAVGCPVVVIFGRTASIYGPTRWRPLAEKAVIVTRSVLRKRWESREKHWRRSFAAIHVDEVESAVRQALTTWAK
jgi:ADP-heptose:LPS heptosyltransferase